MKKHWSIIVILLLLTLSVKAEFVNEQSAWHYAADFMNISSSTRKNLKRAPVNIGNMDAPAFYVFSDENAGFVIVSSDDRAYPVLAYSPSPFPTEDDMPENLRYWLEMYKSQISVLNDGDVADEDVREEWRKFREGKLVKSDVVLEPLIKTQWNQNPRYSTWSANYNLLCPYDSEQNAYCVTGCVATAMAQIMKYYEWPKNGRFSYSYTPKSNPQYGLQTADFANTQYDWVNMPNQLNDKSSNVQIKAIARLMYHCGVAIDMDYSPVGSYAASAHSHAAQGRHGADFALYTYFNYSKSLHTISRDDCQNDSVWKVVLKKDLLEQHPILYTGYDATGSSGHSFVLDGYDSDDYFHFNFGWDGSGDGYYLLDAVKPLDYGAGAGIHDYSYHQRATIGIKPADENEQYSYIYQLKFYEEPMLSTDTIKYTQMPQKVSTTMQLANYDINNFNGKVAMKIVDEFGVEHGLTDYEEISINGKEYNQEGGFTYWHSGELNFQFKFSFNTYPGIYHLIPVYENSNGEWIELAWEDYYDRLQVVVFYATYLAPYSKFEMDSLFQDEAADITVQIANWADKDYSGKFRLELLDINNMSTIEELATIDIMDNPLPSRTYSTYTFSSLIKSEPGDYVLCLSYYDANYDKFYWCGYTRMPSMIPITIYRRGDNPDNPPVIHDVIEDLALDTVFLPDDLQYGSSNIIRAKVTNNSDESFNGSLRFKMFNKNDSELGVCPELIVYLEGNATRTLSLPLNLVKSMMPGQYRLRLEYKSSTEDDWQLIDKRFDFEVVNNQSLYRTTSYEYNNEERKLYHNKGVQLKVTVQNDDSRDFTGWIALSLYTNQMNIKQKIDTVFIDREAPIRSGEQKRLRFGRKITADPGTYRLVLTFQWTGTDTVLVCGDNKYTNFVKVTVEEETLDAIEENKQAITVYPNPASDLILINGVDASELIIYSLQGQVVRRTFNQNYITVADLPEQNYVIIIKRDGLIVARQLIGIKH